MEKCIKEAPKEHHQRIQKTKEVTKRAKKTTNKVPQPNPIQITKSTTKDGP